MESNPAHSIEISQPIDQGNLSSLQITVMILSALVVGLDGYHIQSMALIVPTLSAQRSTKSSDFSLARASALFASRSREPFWLRWVIVSADESCWLPRLRCAPLEF